MIRTWSVWQQFAAEGEGDVHAWAAFQFDAEPRAIRIWTGEAV